MKKILLPLMAVALTGMAFGQNLNLSAGALAGYAFAGSYYKYDTKTTPKATIEKGNAAHSLQGALFLDATYLEAAVSVEGQIGKTRTSTKGADAGNGDADLDTQSWNVNLVALGKYPFAVGSVTLFPLAGLEYAINVSLKDKDKLSGDAKNELHDFFADLGLGADFPISDRFYLRGQAYYGVNLTPTVKATKDNNDKYSDYGHKVVASVGVGYRF